MRGQRVLTNIASAVMASLLMLTSAGHASFAAGGSQVAPTAHFTDPDGVVGDNFGESVALSADGSTALIGASTALVNGVSVGKAYIYSKVNGVWSATPVATFTYPGPSGYPGLFGSAVALSKDGSSALVSAPGNEQVYVYHRTNGLWGSSPIATLNNPDPADGGGPSEIALVVLLASLPMEASRLSVSLARMSAAPPASARPIFLHRAMERGPQRLLPHLRTRAVSRTISSATVSRYQAMGLRSSSELRSCLPSNSETAGCLSSQRRTAIGSRLLR